MSRAKALAIQRAGGLARAKDRSAMREIGTKGGKIRQRLYKLVPRRGRKP